MRVRERTEQTTVEITVDWELKSMFIAAPGQSPVEYEFTTTGELARLLVAWLIEER